MDKPQQSKTERAWQELAEKVRAELTARVGDINGMSATDAKTFVEACRASLWFEQDATLYEDIIEKEQHRLYCDT